MNQYVLHQLAIHFMTLAYVARATHTTAVYDASVFNR